MIGRRGNTGPAFQFFSSGAPGCNAYIRDDGFHDTPEGCPGDGEFVCSMIGGLLLVPDMVRVPLGAGGNTEPAGMVFSILAAFEHVKANVAPILGAEIHSGKGFHRTGINADVTFSARPIEGSACFQGSVGQHRYKAGSGPETVSQEKAAFADPANSG